MCVCLSLSVVSDSVTEWTVAPRLLCPWDYPGKNTEVGCHFLLQGISLIQGSNPQSPALKMCSLPVSHQGRPYTLVSCPLSFTSLSLNISVKCLILSQHLLLSLPPAPSYSWFNQLIQWISADPRAGQNRCHPQPQTTGLEWEVASHHYKWIAFYLQPIFVGKKWLLRLAAA